MIIICLGGLFLIFGCLFLYKKCYGSSSYKSNTNSNETSAVNSVSKLPYKQKYILSKAEYSFYLALSPLADKHHCIVCPKVGLKDLIEVDLSVIDKNDYMKYFGKISQKHVDFLVCDNKLKPIFAIELDDKSHKKDRAKEKDSFKDQVFAGIGLPLKRIKVGVLNAEDIEKMLFFDLEEL